MHFPDVLSAQFVGFSFSVLSQWGFDENTDVRVLMVCLSHTVGTHKYYTVLYNQVCFPVCLGFQEVRTLGASVAQA